MAFTRDIIAAVSRVNATDICRYPRAHATDINLSHIQTKNKNILDTASAPLSIDHASKCT